LEGFKLVVKAAVNLDTARFIYETADVCFEDVKVA
jgi:hypothetical protein